MIAAHSQAIQSSVLALNRHYLPVHVLSVTRAFCLLYKGAAEVISVDEGTFHSYNFDNWLEVGLLRMELGDCLDVDWIRAVNFEIQVPRIIRLLRYDRLPRNGVKFNRRNIFLRDENRCQYCGKRFGTHSLSLDHVMPKSRGGPTTCKVRFMGRAQHRHPHQMLRVDREVRHPIRTEIAQQLLNSLLPRLHEFQAVLISDYAKGVCTAEVLRPLISAARAAGIPVVADPAAGGDYNLYRGATGVTPNRSETQKATGIDVRSIDAAFTAGRILVEKFGLDMAFVTLDRDGIVLVRQDDEPVHLPTRVREVYDVTGAGDMVLAMFGLGMAAGIEPTKLCRLANVAGGLEVEQVGVVRISRKEILTDLLHGSRRAAGKVCSVEELSRHVSARRKAGQKVVLTNGCFDLLHIGHLSYLQEAAREGDCLIVAINSDQSVRRLNKAPDRPIFDEEYRSQMLAGLESVDYVVIFDEATPHAILRELQPDVLVKGGTYRDEEIVGREVVLGYGGRVKALGVTPGVSTTEIVRRLRDASTEAISIPIANQSDRRAA